MQRNVFHMFMKNKHHYKPIVILLAIALLVLLAVHAMSYAEYFSVQYDAAVGEVSNKEIPKEKKLPPLDTVDYDRRMLALANNPPPPVPITNPDGTITEVPPVETGWPVKGLPYPNPGALLPFHRIVAYYGNFYSTKMGALGEYEPEVMLAKLKAEKAAWEAADPTTPVIPALHYIASTAQKNPGADGIYSLRMPDAHIEKAIALAKEIDGVVFLDLQIGHSTVEREIPILRKYLSLPQVHLGLDPEFAMKTGAVPGTMIGTLDAKDINWAAEYLASLVREYNLPPKVLVVHRFTSKMLTNYQDIRPLPEVQIVIEMDGWGFGAKKINTYKHVIYSEPVQFTGFKIFYKNDLKPPSTRLLTPSEILDLSPKPIYIQYQ
ncbi:MAG: hypothetical protein MUD00_02205 [Candidatus Pacebacteria bacterium]|jgi:hypothetical protein|nr:hypothetical protein [Candidatus Paceibacterota bacterium]